MAPNEGWPNVGCETEAVSKRRGRAKTEAASSEKTDECILDVNLRVEAAQVENVLAAEPSLSKRRIQVVDRPTIAHYAAACGNVELLQRLHARGWVDHETCTNNGAG